MHLRHAVLLLLALLLAVPAAAGASQSAPVLVTGGGQVLASFAADSAGPGDTVTFVGDESRQSGSVQVTQTSQAGDGQSPEIIYNGQVTCVEVEGERAILGGVQRAGADGPEFFELEVLLDTEDEDGERGASILFRGYEEDNGCEGEDDGSLLDPNRFLARGNAKIDTARSGR